MGHAFVSLFLAPVPWGNRKREPLPHGKVLYGLAQKLTNGLLISRRGRCEQQGLQKRFDLFAHPRGQSWIGQADSRLKGEGYDPRRGYFESQGDRWSRVVAGGRIQ